MKKKLINSILNGKEINQNDKFTFIIKNKRQLKNFKKISYNSMGCFIY